MGFVVVNVGELLSDLNECHAEVDMIWDVLVENQSCMAQSTLDVSQRIKGVIENLEELNVSRETKAEGGE